MFYKYNREENEAVIRMLTDRYPKCFVQEPRLRRPLKNNITADLEKDGIPVASDLLSSAVDWYKSYFGYLYSLQAGAKRVDLNGVEVSTVTESECNAAQSKIKEIREKQNANSIRSWSGSDPTETLREMRATRQIPDDQVRKLDAPPTPRGTAPELARLYEAVGAANATLSGASDACLRSVMATAALGVVRDEAQRVIDKLSGEGGLVATSRGEAALTRLAQREANA